MSCVYAFGSNGQGQLGLAHDEDVDTPQRSMLAGDGRVSKIACGGNHSVVLMSNGTLAGCGDNRRGELQGECTLQQVRGWTAIEVPAPVVDVACGWDTTVVVDTHGHVWQRGGGRYGFEQRQLRLDPADGRIAVYGCFQNFVVVQGSQVYGWGSNTKCQLQARKCPVGGRAHAGMRCRVCGRGLRGHGQGLPGRGGQERPHGTRIRSPARRVPARAARSKARARGPLHVDLDPRLGHAPEHRGVVWQGHARPAVPWKSACPCASPTSALAASMASRSRPAKKSLPTTTCTAGAGGSTATAALNEGRQPGAATRGAVRHRPRVFGGCATTWIVLDQC